MLNPERSDRVERKFGPQGIEGTGIGHEIPEIRGAHEMAQGSAGGVAKGSKKERRVVRPASWEDILGLASETAEDEGRDALLREAKRRAEEALAHEQNVTKMTQIAKAIGEIDEQLAGPEVEEPEAVNIVEIQRQLEYVLNPNNFRSIQAQQAATQRWLSMFAGTPGVSTEMSDTARAILAESPGKALEIEPTAEMKIEVRMAMIRDLGVSTSGDPSQKCEQFVRQQVSRLGGIGKTHFSTEFEKDLREEYLARAELAAVVGFWDDLASIMSKSTDVWKEMSEARIDRCVKLSKSTYEWLASGQKRVNYRYEEGLERSNQKEVELREQMDTVSGSIFAKMVAGDLDIWITRGEDRWAMIGQIAQELKVSTDAVRLSWQLAEAECWQARVGVGFVSHPAAKVVLASKFRDFRTRKIPDAPVPGGSRLWSEYLKGHNNKYPEEDDANTYDAEGRRLARVGFESWVIRVSKDNDATGQPKDSRYGKYRDGVVFLFSESGKIPKSLETMLSTDLIKVDRDGKYVLEINQSRLNEGITNASAGSAETRAKLEALAQGAIGGERALLAGQYFSQLEILLKQPGLLDVDLPQTVTMTDISKAAGVFDAIEAFGKIDASKASTEELAKLRGALTGQYFRFQSNDLETRGGGKLRRIVVMEGTDRERTVDWWIGAGVQERMAKARIVTGQLMEQWARSYVWLLSWENPNHKSESTVVGMRDWLLLAREVARAYDEQRQWGEYIGYGYGNYDKNELAVTDVNSDDKGKPPKQRIGATAESKQAAKDYVVWFEKMRKANNDIVTHRRRRMSDDRRTKDIKEQGTYFPGFFWVKTWW